MKFKQNLSLLFWLYRGKASKDGKAPIYVRITIDGTDTDISLGKKIHPDFWNSDAKLVTTTTAEAKMINLKIIQVQAEIEDRYYETFGGGMIILSMPDSGKVMTNNSFIPFSLEIKNDGTQSIEKFQLIVSIVGDISRVATSNKESSPSSFARIAGIPSRKSLDYEIDESKLQFRIIPRKEVLVGDDNYISDKIYIKPSPRQQPIELHWKLISRDFRTNGSLTIHSSPRFEEITKSVQEENIPAEESPVIEDHLE